MKKVLIAMPDLRGAGAEKVLIDILNNINLEKFDVTLILFMRRGIHMDEIPSKVKVICMSDKLGTGLYKYWMKMFYLAPRFFYKMFIKEKFDTEIAFMEGIPTKLIANSPNRDSKKIAWVHIDLEKLHWTKQFFKSYEEEEFCYDMFNEIEFVSKDSQLAFERLFSKNKSVKKVIYNPIISDEIECKAMLENIKNDIFTVISSGRLTKQKGYDRLLKAHKELVNQYPHKLVILGEGEERESLENLIKELKIQNSVELKGFIKNPYPYIKAADVFICSSRTEGFSLVVAEALVLKKPIISTEITGPKEVLNNGEFGLLCESSVEGIKNGLEKLLSDRSILDEYKKRSLKGKESLDYKKIIIEIEDAINN
ncbi:MAG: glycosyltransferase [Sarcina sp.]